MTSGGVFQIPKLSIGLLLSIYQSAQVKASQLTVFSLKVGNALKKSQKCNFIVIACDCGETM